MKDLENKTLKRQYFLRRFVDSGGMADVYLAWDQLRATQMAVKVLRRDLASNERFYQMFAKEAQLLQSLNHPNIVRLYEFDRDQGVVFIVMDWIDGENVRRQILKQKGPLPLQEAARILDPVCRALNFAHQLGVYHCDVKPANILLQNDGKVVLTDFGVARHAAGSSWGGTPVYMAPEQFPELPYAGKVDARTDVYALGVTIYEMLSGGWVPYRGDGTNSQGQKTRERIAWELANLPFTPLSRFNPKIPATVEYVVQVALSKDPARRYASTLELNQAFQQALQSRGVTTERKTESGAKQKHQPAQAQASPDNAQPVQPPVMKAMTSPPPQAGPAQIPMPPPGTPATSFQTPEVTQKLNSPLPPVGPFHSPPPTNNSTPKGPYLFGRTGEWTGKTVEIPRSGLLIGRSSSNQVYVREPSVSRLHAAIIRQRFGRGVYIRDENSSLGVTVNGQRVQAATLVQLKSGDIIQIGYYQVFEYREK